MSTAFLFFLFKRRSPLPSSELLEHLDRGAREDGFQHALDGLLRISPPAVVMGVVCEHIFEGLRLEVTPEPFPCRWPWEWMLKWRLNAILYLSLSIIQPFLCRFE